MTNSFVAALGRHAQAAPSQAMWLPLKGEALSYGQCQALALEMVEGSGLKHLPPGSRVAHAFEMGAQRLAMNWAGAVGGWSLLCLSTYQRSGRFEDLLRVWHPAVKFLEGSRAVHASAPPPAAPVVVYDLEHGINLPRLSLVGQDAWLNHWQSLIDQAPLAPGERVAYLLPDTIGTGMDVWAWAAGQGAVLREVSSPAAWQEDWSIPVPSDVRHIHATAVQAVLMNGPELREAEGVVWIHGPCPDWLLEQIPQARRFPTPAGSGTLEHPSDKRGLYAFAVQNDPDPSWRQQKEEALVQIPGILQAIVPVHPLAPGNARPVGVLCLEEADPELVDATVVSLNRHFLRYCGSSAEGLLNDTRSMVQWMADGLEPQLCA